jgi:CRP-like cAMP-binding protein
MFEDNGEAKWFSNKGEVMKQNGIMNTETAFLTSNSNNNHRIRRSSFGEEKISDPHFREKMPGRMLAGLSLENQLLSSLNESSLINLLPFMERVNFSRDQYVVRPESNVDYVYFPESAVVSEIQILEDGRTVEVSIGGRESGIGLTSVFDHKSWANWTQVAIPGTALKINIDILRGLVERDSLLQMTFFEHINAYIKRLTQRVVCYSYHSVEERFCAWLLMLHRLKPDVSLALTQDKMARSIGVHRPSLTNIALLLREKKIIAYTRGRLIITNPRELKKYACICHSC